MSDENTEAVEKKPCGCHGDQVVMARRMHPAAPIGIAIIQCAECKQLVDIQWIHPKPQQPSLIVPGGIVPVGRG